MWPWLLSENSKGTGWEPATDNRGPRQAPTGPGQLPIEPAPAPVTVAQPEASTAATGGARGKRRSSFRVAVSEIRLSAYGY